jgi:tRNA A-37 threonylcarbamoyl transferase component Bud32
MPLAQGQILQNRYRIVRLLGQGGMAAVYLAQDMQQGNRWVAIKEMIPDPNAGPQALAQARTQFRREAQVLMSLRHHNLPQVYENFAEGGNEYLVMQYIEGRNLLDIAATDWQQGRTLGEGRVLGWAIQIMDALEYLHGQRPYPVLHRDVKPQNIILTPGGELYLVDFGLVKLLDPNNPQTMTALRGLGTPEYAPPEQYATGGTHTGPHSDVFALGATLYHLLTGQPPSTATDRLLPAPMTEPLVSPRQLNPAISLPVEQALVKALELTPTGRFTSVAEMRAELLAALPRKRHLPNWLAAGVVGLLVVGILIGALLAGVLGLGRGTATPTTIAWVTPTPIPLTETPVPPTDTPTIPPPSPTPTRKPMATPTATRTPTASLIVSPTPASQFHLVSLASIANDDLSAYGEPPTGDMLLGGVPFYVSVSFGTQGDFLRDRPTSAILKIDPPISHPAKVFILMNSGNTYKHFKGLQLGIVDLRFSDGSLHTTQLIAGKNIREWRFTAPGVVSTISSSDVQEVYRVKRAGEDFAVLDMLTITIPEQQRSSDLIGIMFTDTSQDTTGSLDPGFFVAGVTVLRR